MTATEQGVDSAPEPIPVARIGAWLATLEPGYFALVMATGIVAIGCRLLGFPVLANALLVLAIIGFIVLTVSYSIRAVRFPRRVLASLRSPSGAVGYFTVVAGTNVIATALLPFQLWTISLTLGAIAFVVWFALTYGLFSSIVLAGHRPLLREIGGAWLGWVVGTQSVAVLAITLAPQVPWQGARDVLDTTAVIVWGIGIVFYFILAVIIFLRLLTVETTPAEMEPTYWILMGATAISVCAAARILLFSSVLSSPLLAEMHSFIAGAAVVLWSFGTWFIPALVAFGFWRYVLRRYSWRYEPKLWSVVFPLGMYTVASVSLGRAIDFEFTRTLASVWVWVGVTAWVVVAVLMIIALARSLAAPLSITVPSR